MRGDAYYVSDLALPGGGGHAPGPAGLAWAAVGFSIIFATAFSFSAWQSGISRIGANRVLIYQYLITLTGVVCGVLLLTESLGANQLLGAAVIFCGVYLGRRQ